MYVYIANHTAWDPFCNIGSATVEPGVFKPVNHRWAGTLGTLQACPALAVIGDMTMCGGSEPMNGLTLTFHFEK